MSVSTDAIRCFGFELKPDPETDAYFWQDPVTLEDAVLDPDGEGGGWIYYVAKRSGVETDGPRRSRMYAAVVEAGFCEKLKAFCELVGVEMKEPKWLLLAWSDF